MGKLVPGTFDFGGRGEDIVIREAPSWTVDVLRAMEIGFVRLLDERPRDLPDRVEDLLPDAESKALWRRVVGRLDESATLRVLVKLSSIVGGVAAAPEAVDTARTAITEVLRFVAENGRAPW